jgi:hypothetical protein
MTTLAARTAPRKINGPARELVALGQALHPALSEASMSSRYMDLAKLLSRTISRFHSRWTETSRGYKTPCWIWTGKKNSSGYGCFQIARRLFVESLAHRSAHILLIGSIPKGKEIDHLCRQRDCVNPAHFRLVTHQVNVLAGDTFAATNSRKTHCPQGHAYTSANTKTIKGSRHCRACHRIRNKEWYQRVRKKNRQL